MPLIDFTGGASNPLPGGGQDEEALRAKALADLIKGKKNGADTSPIYSRSAGWARVLQGGLDGLNEGLAAKQQADLATASNAQLMKAIGMGAGGGGAPPLGFTTSPDGVSAGNASASTLPSFAGGKSAMSMPAGTAPAQYADLFASKESQYGLPSGYLTKTARIESSFDPNAVSPTGATGLFQFTRGTGRDYGLITPNGDNRRDPEANTDAAARLAADNAAQLQAAGIEPTGDMLYAAHNMGVGAAIQMARGTGALNGRDASVNGLSTDPSSALAKIRSRYQSAQAGLPASGATETGFDAMGSYDGMTQTPDGFVIPPAPQAPAPMPDQAPAPQQTGWASVDMSSGDPAFSPSATPGADIPPPVSANAFTGGVGIQAPTAPAPMAAPAVVAMGGDPNAGAPLPPVRPNFADMPAPDAIAASGPVDPNAGAPLPPPRPSMADLVRADASAAPVDPRAAAMARLVSGNAEDAGARDFSLSQPSLADIIRGNVPAPVQAGAQAPTGFASLGAQPIQAPAPVPATQPQAAAPSTQRLANAPSAATTDTAAQAPQIAAPQVAAAQKEAAQAAPQTLQTAAAAPPGLSARAGALIGVLNNPYAPAGTKAAAQALLKQDLESGGRIAYQGSKMFWIDPAGKPSLVADMFDKDLAKTWTDQNTGITYTYNATDPQGTLKKLTPEGAPPAYTDLGEPQVKGADGNMKPNPGFAQRKANGEIVYPGKSGVEVNIGDKNQDAYNTEMIASLSATHAPLAKGVESAKEALHAINAMDAAAKRIKAAGGTTGLGKEEITKLQSAYNTAAGLFGLEPANIADEEALRKFNMQLAGAQAKAVGGARVTNFEMQNFLRANPGLETSPEGNERLLGIQRQIQERNISLGEQARQMTADAVSQGKKVDPVAIEKMIRTYDQENPLRDPLTGQDLTKNPRLEIAPPAPAATAAPVTKTIGGVTYTRDPATGKWYK